MTVGRTGRTGGTATRNRRGLDEVSVCWLKRRWKCRSGDCERGTFTEALPQVPPGCRMTSRLRELAGAEVAERGCTVAEAGRWHTCFFDLAGDQGLLGQVEGRTADDAAYWMWLAGLPWRDHVEVVAIDMCSIYASAVRRMLPHATLVVDLFHVVQLAVKMTGDVRRRVVRGKYGGAAGPATPSTGSRGCWCATWSTCPQPSSPRSWTASAATPAASRSWPRGSPRKNFGTR
jgi:hypothetical protein